MDVVSPSVHWEDRVNLVISLDDETRATTQTSHGHARILCGIIVSQAMKSQVLDRKVVEFSMGIGGETRSGQHDALHGL